MPLTIVTICITDLKITLQDKWICDTKCNCFYSTTFLTKCDKRNTVLLYQMFEVQGSSGNSLITFKNDLPRDKIYARLQRTVDHRTSNYPLFFVFSAVWVEAANQTWSLSIIHTSIPVCWHTRLSLAFFTILFYHPTFSWHALLPWQYQCLIGWSYETRYRRHKCH